MPTYSVFDARNSLSRLIEESRKGRDVVIAKRGRPVARVIPVDDGPDDFTGETLAAWLAANPMPDRLRRSADELDAQIAEARDGWE